MSIIPFKVGCMIIPGFYIVCINIPIIYMYVDIHHINVLQGSGPGSTAVPLRVVGHVGSNGVDCGG